MSREKNMVGKEAGETGRFAILNEVDKGHLI
jgi:hypothetical protein